MAAAQETAISPDTEATGHTQHRITVTLQEATAHIAIQAVALQVLHAPTQAVQAAQVQAQDHQVAVAAVHAAVAASVTEAEEDKFEIKRLRNSFYPQSSSSGTIVHCKL